ncbi:MAG: hypothetical protein K0R17_853 [Rariglobus sp.]|jgi:hypothetical protein|nr:hypothetical protein [Rariglobus sp.]
MRSLKPLLLAFTSLIAAVVADAVPLTSLHYQISSGGLNGTLDGVEFSNATWSISASGSPELVGDYAFNLGTEIPFKVIPVNVAPVMTITDTVNSWSFDLENSGTLEWFIMEIDYSPMFGPDTTGYGFGLFDPAELLAGTSNTHGFVVLGSATFGNLVTGESFDVSGSSGGGSSGNEGAEFLFPTSNGDLLAFAVFGDAPGAFSAAAAVPEPAAFAGLAGLGALGWAAGSRRRRR